MPDFSTIVQDPTVRALVQQNLLERAFHDALFPRLLYRGEAVPVLWPENMGDTIVQTGAGLIAPNMQPLVPGQDPLPVSYQAEQWTGQLQQYAGTIDTPMPTSIVAIANIFYRNAQQLGLMAGQTLNRIARNRLYNAGLAGSTVATGSGSSSTSIHVARINGFTTARRPDLSAGSPVLYQAVSTSNPLPVLVGAAQTAANVTAVVPDNAGDTIGPGTLTLDTSCTWATRDPVLSTDRTNIIRVGGALSVAGITSANILQLASIRSAVARMQLQNVPEWPDGRFHCHLDPTSQNQIFSDPEWQRVNTALPDYYMYRQFAVGEILGTVMFRNSEAPLSSTVVGGSTATFSLSDPFPGELYSTGAVGGVNIHRPLFTAPGMMYEYYQDLSGLITEAGITGKIGEPKISNNSIEVNTDRIQLVIRAPLNRLQDQVSTTWKIIADWPLRTDATTGDAARYKRVVVIEHGE